MQVSPAQVTLADISLAQLKEQAAELFTQHFKELSIDGDRGLDIAWPVFEVMAKMGQLHAVGAFIGDALVGYTVSILCPRHLHYDYAYVQNDVLFVAKEHRDGSVGGRLMAAVRSWGREHGAVEVMWHAKDDTELHRKLDKNGRFRLRDHIYSESI